MADNYLEKKFEEHLSAPSKPVVKHTPRPTRHCVVLGGSSGVGAAVVRTLRVAGHKVCFCDADAVRGRETALKTGADYVAVDVSNVATVVAFLTSVRERWGSVEIVVNCLSSSEFGEAMRLSAEMLLRVAEFMEAEAFARVVTLCRRETIVERAVAGAVRALTVALSEVHDARRMTVNCLTIVGDSDVSKVVRFFVDEGCSVSGQVIEI